MTPQELRSHKQAIRSFIREHWSDQKLAEVTAFCADGKMQMWDSRKCLLAATYFDALPGIKGHYQKMRTFPNADCVEEAYRHLGFPGWWFFGKQPLRDRRLLPILKAEARRRDKIARLNRQQEELACQTK